MSKQPEAGLCSFASTGIGPKGPSAGFPFRAETCGPCRRSVSWHGPRVVLLLYFQGVAEIGGLDGEPAAGPAGIVKG